MSKRIVDIPDRTYDFIMGLNQHTFGSKYAHKDVQADIVKAVKESKPYDDSGDLISREALKAYARTILHEDNATNFSLIKMFDEIIDDVPAVETFTLEDMQNNYDAGVDSVIGKYDKAKGEWKTVEGYDGDEYYECSNCGEPWVLYAGTPKENNMNFCPNCGAKMSTEAEDAVPQSKKEVKAIETEHS